MVAPPPKGEDAGDEPRLDGPVQVQLDVGHAADDPTVAPVVESVRRYVAARTESVRTQEVTPAMAQVATLPWLNTQLDVVDQAQEHGWTVPSAPVVQVASVQVEGPDALVQLCLWEPSTGFVVQQTGEPVESGSGSGPEGWTPFDVKMVQVEGRWLVDGAALADHECTGG